MLTSTLHISSWTGWFEIDKEHNHNVYVSGLPQDITKEEFVELMSKCGIITENDDGTRKLVLFIPWPHYQVFCVQHWRLDGGPGDEANIRSED